MDTYQLTPKQDNSPNIWLILFFLFIIISVVIVGIIYIQKKDTEEKKIEQQIIEEKNAIINQTYSMLIEMNNKEHVNYKVSVVKNNTLIQEGRYISSIKEEMQGMEYNISYRLEARSDGYYYNSKECLVLGNTTCNLQLKKTGKYNISIEMPYVRLWKLSEGYLQSPILCLGWDYHYYTIKLMDLNTVQAPINIKHLTDICYDLGGDKETEEHYTIILDRYTETPGTVHFYLLDKDADSNGIISYLNYKTYLDLETNI